VYFSRLERTHAQQLLQLLVRLNLAEGIAAQRTVFAINNPLQPVLGGKPGEMKTNIEKARGELRIFWKQVGSKKRNGPTVRDMASEVGLISTYDYVYNIASNFVHFNPQNLLRSGWGDPRGPFEFSLRYMSSYYQAVASFYRCILFVGFHSAVSPQYFDTDLKRDVDRLIT
jgi:uncharacterized protein DUF5677